MRRRELTTFGLLAVTAVFLLAGMIALVLGQIRGLESRVAALSLENMTLSQQLSSEQLEHQKLKKEASDLRSQITELQKPVPIQEPALFPISRVLARRGDTVASLAEREQTDPIVIHQLNRWLEGRNVLEPGQPIWIPTHQDE